MRKWVVTADDYDPNHPPKSIKKGVRAAIIKDGQVCLLYVSKYDHFTLPGGGIEPHETKEMALIREIHEETGFNLLNFEPVLELEERFNDSIWQNTFYFSTINDTIDKVHLTQEEKDLGMKLMWMPILEALTLLSQHQGAHPHSEAIMTREFLGLSEALNHI